MITEYLEYLFNSSSDSWEYHDNNNVAVYYDYDWDESGNDWMLSWKEEYEYDNDHNYDELVLPWFYHDDNPNYMNHRLTGYTNYNNESSNWIPAYKGQFYYSASQATAISDYKREGIRYFPNPASSEVTFNFGFDTKNVKLAIYDVTGNMVHARTVKNNKPVNIGFLSGGLYLFRLMNETNDIIYKNKIIVK